MKDLDLVSVIIPSFNRLNYVGEAILSAENQLYVPIEIIVVDDGSKDGSLEYLNNLEKTGRIKLLFHEGHKNKGQSASINLGIKNSSGSYIAILDSDDLFSPGKIERQVDFLKNHTDIGMVYGKGHAVDVDGNFLFEIPNEVHVEINDPNKLLLDCYLALPGGALIRRSVFDDVGLFEEEFRAAQDHDMALRIIEKFKIEYIPELAFYYRKHGESISSKGLETRWKTGVEILKRAEKRFPYRRSTIRKRNAVLNFRLAQTYWLEHKKVKSAGHIIASGILDPVRAVKVLLGSVN